MEGFKNTPKLYTFTKDLPHTEGIYIKGKTKKGFWVYFTRVQCRIHYTTDHISRWKISPYGIPMFWDVNTEIITMV